MACPEPCNTASCTTTPLPRLPIYHRNPPLSSMTPSLNGLTGACLSGKPGVAPLQGFVQELIRRSRTSGTVLQTALCYIEAVRRNPQRSQAHPPQPGRKLHTRNPPRMANWRHQNRPPRRHFFAPAGPLSHPLSWRQIFSRIGATPTEPGRNSLVSVLVRLAGAKRRLAMLWVGKQSGKPLARSRSHADLSFGTMNLYGTSSRTIGRSRTLPSIGTGCSNAQAFPVALTPPKLDPYQEWLILNQSCLEAEEEEPTPVAAERMSVAPMSAAAAQFL